VDYWPFNRCFSKILSVARAKRWCTLLKYSGKCPSGVSLADEVCDEWGRLAFVCSQSVKHVLQDEGFSRPIDVFPLGVDTSKFSKFPVNQLKTQLNLDGKFVIGMLVVC